MKTPLYIGFFAALTTSLPVWAAGPAFTGDVTITNANPDVVFIDDTANETDWEICVDDACFDSAPVSESFAITWEDGTPTGAPFIIETGTDDFLLYLDAAERIGIRTNTPSEELEIASDDPTIALFDTNGPRVWEINSDSESSRFDIRDVTAGTSPFVIESTTASNTLRVDSSGGGRVGISTSSPTAPLHVRRSSDAQILVENTSAAAGADRVMYRLVDASNNKIRFAITGPVHSWTFDNAGPAFQINKVGTGINEYRFEDDGDSRQTGRSFATNHINTSSRKLKTDFTPVDEQAVLEKLASLPITTWRYKTEGSETRHLGPVAEDFQQVFGLSDGEHISTVDASGVALAAIKGLNQALKTQNQALQQKDAEMAELRKANAELHDRLTRLESLLLSQKVANR